MVTIENWEEYAILRADGELDTEGTAALRAFLAAHPELAEEARMYDSLRLVPDEAVVFAGKESLLKPEPRVIRFDRRWVYGVAAGVALLLGSLAVLRSGVEESTGGAVRIAGRVNTSTQVEKTQQDLPLTTEAENTSVAQTAPMRRENTTSEKAPQQHVASTTPSNKEEVPAVPEIIAPLPSTDDRMLAVTAPQEHRAAAVAEVEPQTATATENPEASRDLLARLPIDRERLVVLDDIRKSAAERIQNIRETREKIRNTDVTVALGRRDLFTLRF